MRRVMIIGMSGAGKSTLCRTLGQQLAVPFYHLDSIYHTSGWVARAEDEVAADFDAIAAQDAWVVDGNYRRLSESLRERADVIVFLDFPRWYCMYQVIQRWAMHRTGLRKRVDLAEGFRDEFNFAFLKWVWNWRQQNRLRWLETLQPCMAKVQFFSNRRAIKEWRETL
ncbi:MAG: AAA family ATPase [Alphaproteobacteria bacterium]|nr:MAG: AAA family ATPase [Alphaproteobacteria bacterium]